MKSNYIYLSSVTDLPTIHTSDFSSAVALPSISGDGAYLMNNKNFYKLTCDETSCSWTVMPQTADNSISYLMAMYLPSDYLC